jgi:hypothetical protein
VAGARVRHTWRKRHGRPNDRERESSMTRAFFAGFAQTILFVVVVLAGLFGIFTLVSYLAGPVGG